MSSEIQQINATTYSIPGLGDRLTPPVITLGGKDPKKFAPNLNLGYDFGGTLELQTSGDVEVATLTLSSSGSSAFSSVSGKVGTYGDMTQDDSATGGVVAKAVFKNSSGTTIYTCSVTATGGGGDITIPSVTIPVGGIVDMNDSTPITFTEP